MVESLLELAKIHYQSLIGALILPAFLLLLKWAFPKTPNKKALRIFVGADHISFKARSFQEIRLWRDPVQRMCEHIEIEVYSVLKERFTFYKLSDRKTRARADVELDGPLQIRFKYKDGLFWTAWSEKIKKTIRNPPFQLEVYRENQENQQQPNNNQPIITERTFYENICQDFRKRINNFGNVNIRLMGRIGTGKSSLINTLFYAFTSVWNFRAIAYGRDVIVSRIITKYELIPGQVKIIDMPGWRNDSGFQIMGEIIDGLHDGLEPKMQQQAVERPREHQTPGLNQGPRPQERNVIIFVVAAEDAEEEDSVNKKIIKQVIDLGYPCIAVVTKVDQLSEEGEQVIDHNNFYTDSRVIDCCNELRSLGVNYILPIINYRPKEPIKPQIDYVALHALVEALGLAR